MCWTSQCGHKQYFVQNLCNFQQKPATKIKPPTPRTFVFCKQQLCDKMVVLNIGMSVVERIFSSWNYQNDMENLPEFL